MKFGTSWRRIMPGFLRKKPSPSALPGEKALVLSGGGTKAIFQVGALEYLLKQRKERFKIICGVSSGALNAMMVAQGPDYFERLKALWLRQAETDLEIIPEQFTFASRVVGAVLPGGILYHRLGEIDGIQDSSRLLETIRENSRELKKNVNHTGVHLRIGVVSLQTGKYHALDPTSPELEPHAAELILGSTAIPIGFSPGRFPHNGSVQWIDGGVNQVTPIDDAIEVARVQEVPLSDIVVVCSAPLETEPCPQEFSGLFEIALRVEHILANQIDKQGFTIFRLRNAFLRIQESLETLYPRKIAAISKIFKEVLGETYEYQKYRPLKISTIHPDPGDWKLFRQQVAERYPIDEPLDFWREFPQVIERSGKRLHLAYEFGYFTAKKLLDRTNHEIHLG